MKDLRTLCDEAIQLWDADCDMDGVINEMRAHLAQPEPEGLTDEEILALSQWHEVSYTLSDGSVVYPMQEGTDMKDAVLSFTRAVLARWARPAIEPVLVSERLPGPGVKVLAHYFNSHGKSRTVCARWIPAKFESGDSETDDFLEYDEDSDTFYWPEGWYEEIENWDDYQCVTINEGEVTHWQPLPHWALPVPTSQETTDAHD